MRSRSLEQITPKLRDGIPKILVAMNSIGFPMMITDTFGTVEDQQELWALGRTKPGPGVSATLPMGRTVTKADGIIKKSNHQAHADGFGYAVDCCFVVDGKPSWNENLPWEAYGALGNALGFNWGGNWPSKDRPHLELPAKLIEGQRI